MYESAPAIRELGVGINLKPHGGARLAKLDLLDAVLAEGIPTADGTYYSKHGQRIWQEPLGLAAGYRWPQISIHRGRLLGILHRVVIDALSPDRVHTSHHIAGVGQDGRGPWCDLVDRTAGRLLD